MSRIVRSFLRARHASKEVVIGRAELAQESQLMPVADREDLV
jgi:hypothetical protein